MRMETIELLRSPYKHEALGMVTKIDGNSVLRGKETGTLFPIQNGIANLLIQESVNKRTPPP